MNVSIDILDKDETDTISKRTWNRNIAAVNKVGFSDGASNGQHSMFQSSFDMGFEQGINIGFELGQKKARSVMQKNNGNSLGERLGDDMAINCQICSDMASLDQSYGGMDIVQQEKNERDEKKGN